MSLLSYSLCFILSSFVERGFSAILEQFQGSLEAVVNFRKCWNQAENSEMEFEYQWIAADYWYQFKCSFIAVTVKSKTKSYDMLLNIL